MKLSFKNIGKIEDTEIELKDITVLTGINNSGKSTIGKLIYSISTAINLVQGNYLLLYKYSSIEQELYNLNRFLRFNDSLTTLSDYRESFLELRKFFKKQSSFDWENKEELDFINFNLASSLDRLIEEVKEKIQNDESINQGKVKIILTNLEEKLSKSYDDFEMILNLFDQVLQNEFNNHLISETADKKDAYIFLQEDNGEELYLKYRNDKLEINDCKFTITRKYGETLLLDDPYVIENSYRRGFTPFRAEYDFYELKHRSRLAKQLQNLEREINIFDEDYQERKIRNIFSKVLEGDVRKERGYYKFYSKAFPEGIAFESLSSGMKTFATLLIVIQNGLLNRSEYVIFDEPETHLHPEWQLKLAELIVYLSANYPIRILVTSHSPYFIEALEIFSKNKQNNNAKFYISEKSPENQMLNKMIDITNDLEPIYVSMYQPLSSLEELRDEID